MNIGEEGKEERRRRQNRESQQRWREQNRQKDRANAKTWHCMNKERKKERSKTPRNLFKSYECAAKRRGHKFLLDFEEFCGIINQKECFYCGEQGDVGIDRYDNSKGYTTDPGQCVPCCWWCNAAKSKGTFDEMVERAKGVVETHGFQ